MLEKISGKKWYLSAVLAKFGKTTFALSLIDGGNADESHPAYLNWDALEDRDNIMHGYLPAKQPLVIFDEVHKYARWRNLLKGLYDKNKSSMTFLLRRQENTSRQEREEALFPGLVGD